MAEPFYAPTSAAHRVFSLLQLQDSRPERVFVFSTVEFVAIKSELPSVGEHGSAWPAWDMYGEFCTGMAGTCSQRCKLDEIESTVRKMLMQ